MNWLDYFKYDETSVSCLRWATTIRSGLGGGRINAAEGSEINRKDKDGYFVVGLKSKIYKVHRIIWEIHNRKLLKGEVIDHINRDKGDNKISNLRAVTSKVNSMNQKKYVTNLSGVNGVSISHSYKNGVAYKSYLANWTDSFGIKHGKSFSVLKYGDEEALRLATEYRESAIKELVKAGLQYTENHGKELHKRNS